MFSELTYSLSFSKTTCYITRKFYLPKILLLKTFLKNYLKLPVPIICQLMIKSNMKSITGFKNHLFSIHKKSSYVLAETRIIISPQMKILQRK